MTSPHVPELMHAQEHTEKTPNEDVSEDDRNPADLAAGLVYHLDGTDAARSWRDPWRCRMGSSGRHLKVSTVQRHGAGIFIVEKNNSAMFLLL